MKGILGLVNRVPFPFHRFPVSVYGHRMVARSLDRFLALWFWKFGVFGAAEVGLLDRLCREGMSVLDIGANVGFHTLLFARSVRAGGHVWAFEPDPDNFATLCRNLELNSYGNVTAMQVAVGTAAGSGSLYRSPFHCDHRTYPTEKGQRGVQVTMVSVDEFLPPGQRVDLVKMDIQGAEGMALQGMRRTIASNPALVILMEFWPEGLRSTGFPPETVLSELEGLGFTLYRIDERTGDVEEVGHRETLLEALAGSGYANLLAVSGGGLPWSGMSGT
ncbi:MAG: FkbM family methyltransferase [Candidatus Deferrimicrobiaceae bacterium]